jgi:hypothetical protein
VVPVQFQTIPVGGNSHQQMPTMRVREGYIKTPDQMYDLGCLLQLQSLIETIMDILDSANVKIETYLFNQGL